MFIQDATFLTEDTDDREDIVANLETYAKENNTCVLLCIAYGLIECQDENLKNSTKEYFSALLPPDICNVLLDTNYALIHFSSEISAQQYAEMYFFKKTELLENPEKYVYNCVVSSSGSIDYENLRGGGTLPPTRFHENYTAEDIGNYEKLLQQFNSYQ